LVSRAQRLKEMYAHAHGMRIVCSDTLVNSSTHGGAWNKIALIRQHLSAALEAAVEGADGDRPRWVLWMDWDVLITDMHFELPIEEYVRPCLLIVMLRTA